MAAKKRNQFKVAPAKQRGTVGVVSIHIERSSLTRFWNEEASGSQDKLEL